MCLNINHITVHNNTYFIFWNSKNSDWKYKSYIIKILVVYTYTDTALTFEQIYLFRNAIDCIWFRYSKSSTRWKKLIMFSKDMAVVIYNHHSYDHFCTTRRSYNWLNCSCLSRDSGLLTKRGERDFFNFNRRLPGTVFNKQQLLWSTVVERRRQLPSICLHGYSNFSLYRKSCIQSSGAVWRRKWTTRSPVPNTCT